MNIQVNQNTAFAQLPASKAAAQPAEAPKTSQAPAPTKDSVSIGRGLLSVAGGAGAGILSGTAATAAVVLIAEKGVPKNFGGYLAAGGLLVGGGAGLIGAASSALVTSNPKTGALVGAVTGGAAAAAYVGKTLGTVGGAVLGGVVGAVAGAVGGYTAAKIKN